jgi:capsular exopolysaccharide synthesis family protein
MNSEEIHLRDYLKVVNKHRGLILIFMVLVFAVTALKTFSATRLYSGSSKVMIEKADSSNLTGGYRYSSYDPEFYETQFQLIKSQNVAKRVVENLSLEQTYASYFPQASNPEGAIYALKSWLRGVKAAVVAFVSPAPEETAATAVQDERSRADGLAGMLRAGISVTPVKDSRIVAISYQSTNPQFAALVANSVAQAFIETTLDMKMEATRRTIDWMTLKAEEERAKLEKTETKLQSYMRANDLVTLENRIAVIPQKLSEISKQLVYAQSAREQLEERYRKVKQVAASPDAAESILSITNGNTLQILRDQILKAEQHIRELSTKFGAKHPMMVKAKDDLDILQQKKAQEVNRLIESTKNEYELAVLDENNLRRQMDKTKAEAQTLNEKFIQFQSYNREKESNQQLYDTLLLKMKEQSITGESQPVNLWIVEKALVPLAPFTPRTKVNLLLGLVVGLFGGIGLAFFVEYLDQSIKYPDETERVLGVPVLGLIPLFSDKQGSVERVMVDQSHSPMAESYRALRTSLLLSAADRAPRSILITSPGPGAGKSTTSVNLAIAMAQSGKKVLLIDGDLRKPRLHKILGIEPDAGLSNYLAGMCNTDILQRTAHENLALISSGPIPPNPSELLLSARMQEMIVKLKETFDFIICDSPPIQSVVDGRILSQLFDGTVLVTRAKTTNYDIARKALKQLQDVNAPVLGILINGMELKKSDDYYAAYYTAYGDEPQSS